MRALKDLLLVHLGGLAFVGCIYVVDSEKLEHGCRMIYAILAGFPSFFG